MAVKCFITLGPGDRASQWPVAPENYFESI